MLECLDSLSLKSIKFNLPSNPVCLKLNLLFLSDLGWIFKGLQLHFLCLINLEFFLVLFKLFLKSLLFRVVVNVFNYVETIGLVSLHITLRSLRIIVIEPILKFIMNPFHILFRVIVIDVELFSLIHDLFEVSSFFSCDHLFAMISYLCNHCLTSRKDLVLPIAFSHDIESFI